MMLVVEMIVNKHSLYYLQIDQMQQIYNYTFNVCFLCLLLRFIFLMQMSCKNKLYSLKYILIGNASEPMTYKPNQTNRKT